MAQVELKCGGLLDRLWLAGVLAPLAAAAGAGAGAAGAKQEEGVGGGGGGGGSHHHCGFVQLPALTPGADADAGEDGDMGKSAEEFERAPAATTASTSSSSCTAAPGEGGGNGDDDGALIIFTSGTTGRPKAALHTHASLAAQVRGLCQAWQWWGQRRKLNPGLESAWSHLSKLTYGAPLSNVAFILLSTNPPTPRAPTDRLYHALPMHHIHGGVSGAA